MSHPPQSVFLFLFLICYGSSYVLGHQAAAEDQKPTANLTLVDLTQELDEAIPTHHAYTPLVRTTRYFGTVEKDGFSFKIEELCMATHLGTHMDSPHHYNQTKWSVTDIPLERLVSVPASVIDIRHKVFKNDSEIDPDAQLTVEDITDWENTNGRIRDNSLLLILTGWSRFWNNSDHYLKSPNGPLDESPTRHPGMSANASEWLVRNRPTIYGTGIDCVSIDYGLSTKYSSHKHLSNHNMYILENVANLEQLPATGALVTVGAIKLGREASGVPCRIVATILN